MRYTMISRLAAVVCAIGSMALASCENSPTQPEPIVTPPAPAPAPPPAPPPVPPPGAWVGYIGSESSGFTAITGLPATTQVLPTAINDAGQVVGFFFAGSVVRAFIWSRTSEMQGIGTLPGDKESVATGINADGEIAGYSTQFTGTSRAFRWSRDSGMTELPGLSYCLSTRAHDVNAAGEIVGSCRVDSHGTFRPFRWTVAKGMEDLGTLDADRGGAAMAINDSGVIAGFSNSASIYDDARGVIWNSPGRAVQIGTCIDAWCDTLLNAINNNGDVAGGANGTAFVRWRDGSMRDIGRLPDASNSQAFGINDAGEIIGVSYPPYTLSPIRSFIWTASGGMRELAIPGRTEFVVTAINNKGEIVGYAR